MYVSFVSIPSTCHTLSGHFHREATLHPNARARRFLFSLVECHLVFMLRVRLTIGFLMYISSAAFFPLSFCFAPIANPLFCLTIISAAVCVPIYDIILDVSIARYMLRVMSFNIILLVIGIAMRRSRFVVTCNETSHIAHITYIHIHIAYPVIVSR